MSTPNPTRIIAEHAFGSRWEVSKPAGKRVSCACEWVHRSDGWFDGDTDVEARAIHAEHVVSKLTDAGYSIVGPSETHVDTGGIKRDSQTSEPYVCEGFAWVGQSFASCEECGRPVLGALA